MWTKSFLGGLQGDSNRTDFVSHCVSKVSIQEYRIVSRMNLYTLSSLFRRLEFLCGDSIYICTTENVCRLMLL